MFNHILLEVHCAKEQENNISEKQPDYCTANNYLPTFNCLLNKCPFISFTSHENALCYINKNSEASKIISLGGEMIPEESNLDIAESLWERISFEKINEAYERYLKEINQLRDAPIDEK